ncbi:MAG TPA: 5-oxoprolinase subunit PxpB [Euryarchaeota archaeon]|nr:5-oxoprolinase subunit PxpB [Euryarchaeota archaeon]
MRNVGDSAIAIFLGNKIDEEINDKVLIVAKKIEDKKIKGIIEVVPTYTSVYIYYDPLEANYKEIISKIQEIVKSVAKVREKIKTRTIQIPVAYGGDFGPDLEFVAKYHNMTEDEVIEIHSKPLYRVYMLGFTPGFAYMGGLDKRIATPRLKMPRKKVPAGSVGIAGEQTGIYPIESPGGWRIIGRTPLKLFDPRKEPPTLLLPGDRVKFVPIDHEEFYEFLEEENK